MTPDNIQQIMNRVSHRATSMADFVFIIDREPVLLASRGRHMICEIAVVKERLGIPNHERRFYKTESDIEQFMTTGNPLHLHLNLPWAEYMQNMEVEYTAMRDRKVVVFFFRNQYEENISFNPPHERMEWV